MPDPTTTPEGGNEARAREIVERRDAFVAAVSKAVDVEPRPPLDDLWLAQEIAGALAARETAVKEACAAALEASATRLTARARKRAGLNGGRSATQVDAVKARALRSAAQAIRSLPLVGE